MDDARKLLELASDWKGKADILRKYGAATRAAALETCAVELTDAIRAGQDEPLTLAQAVEEAGYSYSSLQQKVAAGYIPNGGTKGRPRVRRYDLPRKTPTPALLLDSGDPDLAGEVLAGRI